MSEMQSAGLALEALAERIVPTTAIFSNGMLFVQGDNLGNNINVQADSSGNIQVSERGQAVQILGATTATTSNVSVVVEDAGTGANNTLASGASLGTIPTAFLGNGTGTLTYAPGNKGPSSAVGSPEANAVNNFISNPGGKDVFVGGKGSNLFDWQPGTGTDTYIGAGRSNTVLVVGNANGSAENDTLTANGTGGVTFSRNNLVPFQIYTTGIQTWYIDPSTGAGNTVTVGDLSGTPTKSVEVDDSHSTTDASNQNDASVKLIVNGTRNTVAEGAGTTSLVNHAVPTDATLVQALAGQLKK
jgi:hypothetical protein